MSRVKGFDLAAVTLQDDGCVNVNIDPSIQAGTFAVQKKTTADGNTEIVQLTAVWVADRDQYDVHIVPVENIARNVFESTARIDWNMITTEGHKDNTVEQEGVIPMDDSFKLFRKEVRLAAADFNGTFLVMSLGYGALMNIANYPIVNQAAWFIFLVLCDFIVGLMPGVHDPTYTRSATMFSRFKQFVVAALGLAGLVALKRVLAQEPSGEFVGVVINLVPQIGVGMILFAYSTRLIGAFIRVFYGKKRGAEFDQSMSDGIFSTVKQMWANRGNKSNHDSTDQNHGA